jgi:hypothetical protein
MATPYSRVDADHNVKVLYTFAGRVALIATTLSEEA